MSGGPWGYLGKSIQMEGTAGAEVLRQELIWDVQGSARRPVWLEWSEKGESNKMSQTEGRAE